MNDRAEYDLFDYAPMQAADLDEVLPVEEDVYPHPWSRGNFEDSLDSGYDAWVLRDELHELAGYFVLMGVVDEVHLLNVTVAASRQRQGLGRYLLDKVAARARGMSAGSVLLEVRPSNTRALKVYEQYGFAEIGRRKGYYRAADGRREDAIVMRLVL